MCFCDKVFLGIWEGEFLGTEGWRVFTVTTPPGADVGTVITTITANDVDTNPALTYTFAPGGNPLNMFTIDKFSGKITLASPLDHETQSRYTIEVGYIFLRV